LVVLRFSPQVTPGFSLLVHVADIFWPAVISVSTGGPNSPFFLYFIFALLAAGFRWECAEALFTTAAAIAAFMAETFVLSQRPLAQLLETRFDLNGFIMRAGYLVIFGSC